VSGLALSFQATPATRPLSKLQKEVLFYVSAPDDPEALEVAQIGLNDGIVRLNMRNWVWSLDYDDIGLIADTADYPIASSFRAPRHLALLDSNSNPVSQLTWETPKSFEMRFPHAPIPGTPTHYTVFNSNELGTFSLNYKPSSSFVGFSPIARVRYYRRMERLTFPTDSIAAPSDAESFVVWHARMLAAAVYAPDRMDRAERQADKAWRLMVQDDMKSQTSDRSDQ